MLPRLPMLTIKNRCAVFAAALLLAGCMPPVLRALLEGKRLLERAKYAEAIERFQTATSLLATNAQAWQAWNYLGVACQYSGDAAGAERAYQRALMANPDAVEAGYNLGCLWLSQNKFEAAKRKFTT